MAKRGISQAKAGGLPEWRRCCEEPRKTKADRICKTVYWREEGCTQREHGVSAEGLA